MLLAWRGLSLQDSSTSLTLSNITISASARAAFMEMLVGTACTAARTHQCMVRGCSCALWLARSVSRIMALNKAAEGVRVVLTFGKVSLVAQARSLNDLPLELHALLREFLHRPTQRSSVPLLHTCLNKADDKVLIFTPFSNSFPSISQAGTLTPQSRDS